jgi:hypothetical protein
LPILLCILTFTFLFNGCKTNNTENPRPTTRSTASEQIDTDSINISTTRQVGGHYVSDPNE